MTAAPNLEALRKRYQPDYQPVCGGCGQLMRCILWRVFKCDGKVKIGRRWADCPAPEQWERPNEQTRREMLAVLDQLASQQVRRRSGARRMQPAAEQLRLIA